MLSLFSSELFAVVHVHTTCLCKAMFCAVYSSICFFVFFAVFWVFCKVNTEHGKGLHCAMCIVPTALCTFQNCTVHIVLTAHCTLHTAHNSHRTLSSGTLSPSVVPLQSHTTFLADTDGCCKNWEIER